MAHTNMQFSITALFFNHATLVSLWTQDRYLGNTTYGSGGICSALSHKWITCKRTGQNFINTIANPDEREEVMWLFDCQSRNRAQWDIDYLHHYGLTINLNWSCPNIIGEIAERQFKNIINHNANSFMLISISNIVNQAQPNIQAHAMAADTVHNVFFDPNYGEVHFRNILNMSNFIVDTVNAFYPNLMNFCSIKVIN